MSERVVDVVDDPAAVVARRLLEIVTAGGHVALSGGSTPRRAYELAAAAGGDWSPGTLWYGDERCVPPDDERSNHRMVVEALLDRLPEPARPAVHRIEGERGAQAAAAEYDARIAAELGARPVLDLALLGLGSDGHTASLFPGKPEVEERERPVVAVPEAGLEPFVPRVSLTFPVFDAAREVVFLIAGAGKAEAVARAFGPDADRSLPAARVAPAGGVLRLVLDPAAAAGLGVIAVADRYIGVDVGGTKIATAILEGEQLDTGEVEPTDPGGADALLGQIARLVERHRTPETRAVGVGLPSIIDFETGTVRHTVNLPLSNVPVRSRLAELLALPVVVENDASCAALAEAHDGARLVCPELVMFTIGTGVGGGLVLGGRLYRGATGAAAELGHTLIGLCIDDGVPVPPAGFPKPGSLEALAAGRALDRLAISCARDDPKGRLGQRFAEAGSLTGHDVVAAARDGDGQSLRALEDFGERLGVGIANAINTFDPLEVVVGGGVSVAGELLLGPARRVAQAYVVPGIGTKTRIRLARHGLQAGVLGAALIAAHEHGEA